MVCKGGVGRGEWKEIDEQGEVVKGGGGVKKENSVLHVR